MQTYSKRCKTTSNTSPAHNKTDVHAHLHTHTHWSHVQVWSHRTGRVSVNVGLRRVPRPVRVPWPWVQTVSKIHMDFGAHDKGECAKNGSRFNERDTQIQEKRVPKGTLTAHGPLKAARVLPTIFGALQRPSNWELKRTQTDRQSTPKAGVGSDLLHFYDEAPARALLDRNSISF